MSGSVTNPTGSVNGYSLAGLCDAENDYWSGSSSPVNTYDTVTAPVGTAKAQVQHAVLLSSVSGACGRHAGGSYQSAELIVRLRMIAYADLPASVATIPAAENLPLVFTANLWLRTMDGAYRVVQPEFMRGGKNPEGATQGTVSFTAMDAAQYVGSFDLWFGSDHATGQFSAPWC